MTQPLLARDIRDSRCKHDKAAARLDLGCVIAKKNKLPCSGTCFSALWLRRSVLKQTNSKSTATNEHYLTFPSSTFHVQAVRAVALVPGKAHNEA